MAFLCVLALSAAACGGGEDGDAGASGTEAPADSEEESEERDPEEDASGAGDSEDAGSDDGESESVSDQDSGGSSNRSAVITVDGETLNYSMDDVTFSNVEGMDDLTFETCSPDFFGSGRYYAIGYAVDDDGEVIVGDDGGIASQFVVNLPPDDWQETQRDAPEFEITLNDLDLDIATLDEAESMAPGQEMSWTIDDTTASGTAVFVDFDNSYVVEFELVCEGEPTITAGDVSGESDEGDDDGDGGFPLGGAGTGSFVADGESYDNVDVYRCEPFSFGSDPHPDDLSLLAFLGGSSGLEVEISNDQGFSQAGETFDQVTLSAFYSRSGDSGLEQFEGRATNDAEGNWYLGGGFITEDSEPLDGPPFTIDGDRITGELAGLEQTWPDEGAAIVDVSFDLEIPSEVNSEC
jgi:hypothetical protein